MLGLRFIKYPMTQFVKLMYIILEKVQTVWSFLSGERNTFA